MGIRGWLSRQKNQQAEHVPAAIPVTISPHLDIVLADSVRKAHEAAGGRPDDVLPPPLPGRRADYRAVDVPGSWTRAVNGRGTFDDTINALPLGPVLVTMRFEPNDANPYGISAYVHGRQVGWLATNWNAKDTSVIFVRRLDDAGLLPRFQGLLRVESSGDRIINFDYPGRNDGRLGDIARRIIKASSGE